MIGSWVLFYLLSNAVSKQQRRSLPFNRVRSHLIRSSFLFPNEEEISTGEIHNNIGDGVYSTMGLHELQDRFQGRGGPRPALPIQPQDSRSAAICVFPTSQHLPHRQMPGQIPKKRVCIIGAGASGCSAAYALSLSPERFDVTLFERSTYCGGMATSGAFSLDSLNFFG